MAVLIKDKYIVDVQLEDVDVTTLFSIKRIIINESLLDYNLLIPRVKLTLQSSALLGSEIVKDGVRIKITITSSIDRDINDISYFSLVGVKRIATANGVFEYDILGILDVMSFINVVGTYASKSNTSEIFQYFAKQFELESDIDTTNDSQLWNQSGRPLINFFNHLAEYSYTNNTSFNMWCFTRGKKLLYKNIGNILSSPSKYILFDRNLSEDDPSNSLVIDDALMESNSGLTNMKIGYGISCRKYDVETNSTTPIEVKQAVKINNNLNINESLQAPRVNENYITDSNSLYSNYDNSLIRNIRLKSLFNINQRIVMSEIQDINLLDKIEFKDYINNSQINTDYSSTYIVTNVTTDISQINNDIRRYLIATTNSLNS